MLNSVLDDPTRADCGKRTIALNTKQLLNSYKWISNKFTSNIVIYSLPDIDKSLNFKIEIFQETKIRSH